jgi:DNA-binding response OmpR family regulator
MAQEQVMRTKEVLIVEDEIHIAEALAFLVEDAGYRVRLAHNGKEALESISAAPPDLIITDLMMPVMDGAQLLHILREQRHSTVPVVLMSAAGQAHISGMGADATMGKPFELHQVESMLHHFLAERVA